MKEQVTLRRNPPLEGCLLGICSLNHRESMDLNRRPNKSRKFPESPERNPKVTFALIELIFFFNLRNEKEKALLTSRLLKTIRQLPIASSNTSVFELETLHTYFFSIKVLYRRRIFLNIFLTKMSHLFILREPAENPGKTC